MNLFISLGIYYEKAWAEDKEIMKETMQSAEDIAAMATADSAEDIAAMATAKSAHTEL